MSPTRDSTVVVLLSLAMVACPPAEKIDNTDPTKATLYCSVTFGGDVAGTHDCHVEFSQIDGGQWELRLNTVGEANPVLDVRVRWASAPVMGLDYSLQAPSTMTYALAAAHLSTDPTAAWEAGEHATDNLSATITLTYAEVSGGPCGSLNASLDPKSGSTASGAVQVEAVF